jgi:hypothetical protein
MLHASLHVVNHILILSCFIICMLQLIYLQVRTHGYWFLRRVSRTQQQQQQPVSQVSTAMASPVAVSAGAVGVVQSGSALSSSYVVTNKPQQQQRQQPHHTQQSVEDEHDLVTRTDDVLDIAALITALRSGGKRERERDADSDSSSGSSSAGSTSGSSGRCAKRRNVYDTAATAVEYKPAAAFNNHNSCGSSSSNGRSGSNSNTVGPPRIHYEQNLPVRGYIVQ